MVNPVAPGPASRPALGRRPVSSRARFDLLAAMVVVAVLTLAGRLAQVQLLAGADHRSVADGNRVRLVEIPAPRGHLLDAQGRVLAGNRPSYDLTLDWVGLVDLTVDERRTVFLRVVDELNHFGTSIEAERLEGIFTRARRQTLEPVTVADDLGENAWIAVSELGLPGFEMVPVPVRTYPNGPLAAHAIGFIGSVIDDEEATRLNRVDPGHGYRPGSEVGRSGLEKLFERHLRGVPELRRVEVDSSNRVVRTIAIDRAARPGHDVHLELDLDLQELAERALTDQISDLRTDGSPAPAGSFVVLDPADGAVLALASWPAFDPSTFVVGLDSDEADRLFADPADPFLNRAIDGLYPAASTFKPVTALASLAHGLRSAEAVWEDEGSYRLTSCRRPVPEGTGGPETGCRFRNAREAVLGPVDLRRALAVSSDTYFYSLGEQLWLDRSRVGDDALQRTASQLGLGVPTGVELPGEAAGTVPTPADRQADHAAHPEAFPDPSWYTGDTVNLAIGQGGLLVTPIQLANLYATLGSGGLRHQPRLAREVVESGSGEVVVGFGPRPVGPAPAIDENHLTPIIDGLRAATERGTAAGAFAGFDLERFPVAAKTGTAEVEGRTDFALFAGFAPWPRPRYAFAVVVEEGGFGGRAAAPVARRFLAGAQLVERRSEGR